MRPYKIDAKVGTNHLPLFHYSSFNVKFCKNLLNEKRGGGTKLVVLSLKKT